MPAALTLSDASTSQVDDYVEAMQQAGRQTGSSTIQAARTFRAKLERSGGWQQMSLAQQIDAIEKSRSFASWLLVTAQLIISVDLLGRVDLRLGNAARSHRPNDHVWFDGACALLDTTGRDIALQWNTLAKVTAVAGVQAQLIDTSAFEAARTAIIDAYIARGMRNSGRNMASIFHRLQLTLFHAGRIDSLRRPTRGPSVSITGWATVPSGFTAAAQRYVAQIDLSLRPSTVKHIEHDLREFGTWMDQIHTEIENCADLQRRHIEDYKAWIGAKHGRYTGKPLNRVSIKNRLINLHCFFDRITEWGYPDPLSRLIIELLARTGIRKGELLALPVDAVAQIGSAFWLRIPVGKLHNDRYIPLHPQLKEMLDDWISNHRPTGLRSQRLLLEDNRPISSLRVSSALSRPSNQAGIGHVTAHQLRHTLATQAINRGMSIDAIAALLGHKTLAMTMIYARIADKTVAEEYFNVTEKVEALYGQPRQLPRDDEGSEMRKLRGEMHRRMLGNGHCARPVETDCHFESICESCTFFVTTIEFRPTLQAERDDAQNKGQVARQKVFDGLLERLDHEAS